MLLNNPVVNILDSNVLKTGIRKNTWALISNIFGIISSPLIELTEFITYKDVLFYGTQMIHELALQMARL